MRRVHFLVEGQTEEVVVREVLSPHLEGYRSRHPQFRNLFNSYYNAVGPQPEKTLRNTFSRPTLTEVQAYRGCV